MTDGAAAVDAAEQAAPLNPMELARRQVILTRRKKRLEESIADVNEELKAIKSQLLFLVDEGHYPERSGVDDATVYLWTQVWASPAGGDHDHLTAVLDGLGLTEYKPSTVNTQSLSAYVRELVKKVPAFDDDGKPRTLEQRARLALPESLFEALNVTEKREMRVTGA